MVGEETGRMDTKTAVKISRRNGRKRGPERRRSGQRQMEESVKDRWRGQ